MHCMAGLGLRYRDIWFDTLAACARFRRVPLLNYASCSSL